MQSDPEEEFEEMLLKARAPMAAIDPCREVTYLVPGERGGVLVCGGGGGRGWD